MFMYNQLENKYLRLIVQFKVHIIIYLKNLIVKIHAIPYFHIDF